MYEFFAFAQGKTVVNEDCNVLIPQPMFGEGIEPVGLRMVADYFNRIVRYMLNDSDADSSRVYSYDISLGGKCVWNTLLEDPDLYTAAVEAMGSVYNYKTADLKSIAHIPLWLAHSSDDVVVKIDSDDYCYERLKELKADIKYTRGRNTVIKCRRNSIKMSLGLNGSWKNASSTLFHLNLYTETSVFCTSCRGC